MHTAQMPMHRCSRKDHSRRLGVIHLGRLLARFEVRTDPVFRRLSQYQVMVSSIACRFKFSSHSRCKSQMAKNPSVTSSSICTWTMTALCRMTSGLG